jgi:hypothetical protein
VGSKSGEGRRDKPYRDSFPDSGRSPAIFMVDEK